MSIVRRVGMTEEKCKSVDRKRKDTIEHVDSAYDGRSIVDETRHWFTIPVMAFDVTNRLSVLVREEVAENVVSLIPAQHRQLRVD